MASTLGELRTVAAIVVALLVVLGFGWYVVSGQSERQRGATLARLSFDLVRPIGQAGAPIWLRGGGCRYSLDRLKAPFNRVQVVVRPTPRLLPFPLPWIVARSDARNLLGLAIDVNTPPSVAFDLIEPNSEVGRRALRRGMSEEWHSAEWTFNGQPLKLLAPNLASAQEFLRHLPRYPAIPRSASFASRSSQRRQMSA